MPPVDGGERQSAAYRKFQVACVVGGQAMGDAEIHDRESEWRIRGLSVNVDPQPVHGADEQWGVGCQDSSAANGGQNGVGDLQWPNT